MLVLIYLAKVVFLFFVSDNYPNFALHKTDILIKELSITNYALIDHLQIKFENGFSVITGETGSGKSIILGALSYILGDRVDLKSVRDPSKKCIIEGVFILNKKDTKQIFTKYDLDFEAETILRREINPQGKSRAFVNDTPVSLAILRELSKMLIDIHSQHATLLLNNRDFVFELLDSQSKDSKMLELYQEKYKDYQLQKKALETLIEQERISQNEKDYNEFLFKEFEEIDLEKAQEEDLESEFQLLSNAEEIKSILLDTANTISGNAASIIDQLNIATANLDRLQSIDKSFANLSERLHSVSIEIQDINRDIAMKESNLEVDDQRLQMMQEKLTTINQLLKKHQLATIADLATKKEEIAVKISGIESISIEINKVTRNLNNQEKELTDLAKELTKARENIIPKLEKEAQTLLAKMSMKNAEIKFELTDSTTFNKFGKNEIQLLAKTNLGGSFELLKKIASGGESSRIMLAIKSLQTRSSSLPTIIFDEIDTGVSGEVATNMGSIMQSLGSKMQVMSITHLPQIASKGTHHYKVFKQERDNTTHTKIKPLSATERITEIAQMLSSNQLTDAAIKNAEELLAAN